MNIAMATCLSNMPRPPVNPLLEKKMMRQVMRRMANRSPSVAGWWGHGPPLCTGRGSRHREINDGGGYARQGGGRRVAGSSSLFRSQSHRGPTVVVEIEAQEGDGCWSGVVCSLACGKVDEDPIKFKDAERIYGNRLRQHWGHWSRPQASFV